MTDLITKYKFSFNPKMAEKVEDFVNKNFNLEANSVKVENNKISATIRFVTDSKKELFRLHNFLLGIHNIKGNCKKRDVEKPKIAITLKGQVHKGFYFNYLLGNLFCETLKENEINFSVSRIKKNAFHYLDTSPIWITESDLEKIKEIIKKSIIGKTFRVAIINFNVLKEKKK